MELTLNFLASFVGVLVALFAGKFMPAYMTEKGKNLATKEDVAEITKIVKGVEHSFNRDLEEFRSTRTELLEQFKWKN